MQSAGMKVLRVWLDGQSSGTTKVKTLEHSWLTDQYSLERFVIEYSDYGVPLS